MGEYKKYQHVEKLGTDETDGITLGRCYVFPKIDGTNGHVWMEDGHLRFGSRRREIDPESDNQGFAEWCVRNNQNLLNALGNLPTGAHLYGEWLVPHSLKTYRESAWRNFYIFDVVVGESHLPYDEYAPAISGAGLSAIPPLRILVNPSEDNIRKCLSENTYLIADGNGVGEGIVIKNYEFVNKYGRQVWAKVVTNEFKDTHRSEMGPPETRCGGSVELKIVEDMFSRHEAEKVEAKIRNESGWSSRKIPEFLGRCYHDFLTDHMWEVVKEFKNPSINFKVLQSLVYAKAKQHCPHLF